MVNELRARVEAAVFGGARHRSLARVFTRAGRAARPLSDSFDYVSERRTIARCAAANAASSDA